MERPIQRVVCRNHHLQLPFGHLFSHYDRHTTGPIGKAIEEDVWKKDIIKFEKFDNDDLLLVIKSVPDHVQNNFSKGIRLLIEMSRGIITGAIED